MIAGETYETIAQINLEPFPFITCPENLINSYLGQCEVTLLGLVFKKTVEGPEDKEKRIASHLGDDLGLGTLIFGFG